MNTLHIKPAPKWAVLRGTVDGVGALIWERYSPDGAHRLGASYALIGSDERLVETPEEYIGILDDGHQLWPLRWHPLDETTQRVTVQHRPFPWANPLAPRQPGETQS